jgi:hypothetical protein
MKKFLYFYSCILVLIFLLACIGINNNTMLFMGMFISGILTEKLIKIKNL